MVLNTVADLIMREMRPEAETFSSSLDQRDMQRLGEEVLIEKIKGIFDEVARDKADYEESYQSMGQRKTT